MRKIFVLEFITLDGVIQAPGGPEEDISGGFKFGGWTAPFFDEESGKEMDREMKQTAGLLLGRRTYDIWEKYWPSHTETWPQVNKITKYVASKTLKNPAWENTEIVRDVDDLKKLKNSEGSDLQVYGSADLIQTLMKYNLVDEYWLKIFPITLGSGKRLFEKGTMPASFKLAEYKTVPSGVIFARYKHDGDVKTGSMV